jgi:hypothetical protein
MATEGDHLRDDPSGSPPEITSPADSPDLSIPAILIVVFDERLR